MSSLLVNEAQNLLATYRMFLAGKYFSNGAESISAIGREYFWALIGWESAREKKKKKWHKRPMSMLSEEGGGMAQQWESFSS